MKMRLLLFVLLAGGAGALAVLRPLKKSPAASSRANGSAASPAPNEKENEATPIQNFAATASTVPKVLPQPKTNSRAEALVVEIANQFDSPGASFRSADEIQRIAEGFTAQEISNLKTRALDSRNSASERRADVYLLTKAGPAAIPALAEIAGAPISPDIADRPHTQGEQQIMLERTLRTMTLEALDRHAMTDSKIAARLKTVLKTQTDESIRFLATLSLNGLEQGRPGKLSRFIDRTLDERETQ